MNVECNICGKSEASKNIEFGSMKKSSGDGAIGMQICQECREAADWHYENGGEQCASCGRATTNTFQLHQPLPPEMGSWHCEVELCRDCYTSGGFMHMYEHNTDFRAKANTNGSWDTQRKSALSRDSYICQSCGVSECRLHVHHKIPRSHGGTDHLDNLVSLCPDCHADEHGQHACMLCGGLSDVKQFTWMDTSGGSLCYCCDNCWDYIQRGGGSERCSICARFSKTSRSVGIYFQGELTEDSEPITHSACDECRTKVVFGNWPERQQYVDEQLPDSHVDFRHWEEGK